MTIALIAALCALIIYMLCRTGRRRQNAADTIGAVNVWWDFATGTGCVDVETGSELHGGHIYIVTIDDPNRIAEILCNAGTMLTKRVKEKEAQL